MSETKKLNLSVLKCKRFWTSIVILAIIIPFVLMGGIFLGTSFHQYYNSVFLALLGILFLYAIFEPLRLAQKEKFSSKFQTQKIFISYM